MAVGQRPHLSDRTGRVVDGSRPDSQFIGKPYQPAAIVEAYRKFTLGAPGARSAHGTERTCRPYCAMSVIGGKAENICS